MVHMIIMHWLVIWWLDELCNYRNTGYSLMAKRKVKTGASTSKKVTKKASKKVTKKVSKKTAKKRTSRKKTSKEDTKVQQRTNLIGIDPLVWLDIDDQDGVAPANKNTICEQELIEQTVVKENVEKELLEQPIIETATGVDNVNNNETIDINLGTSLTIRDISDLMEELNELDDAKNELVFESEQLEKVDTAALQLLLSFYLNTTGAEKKITWHRPSEAFCHAAGLLGLQEILGIKTISV
jgi:ABC-type transporter Mla MlaB component